MSILGAESFELILPGSVLKIYLGSFCSTTRINLGWNKGLNFFLFNMTQYNKTIISLGGDWRMALHENVGLITHIPVIKNTWMNDTKMNNYVMNNNEMSSN